MTPGLRAAVFGASGAIGSALVDALRADTRYEAVHACSRSGAGHVRFDLLDEASIAAAVGAIAKDGPLDMVIVATGVLQEAEGMAVEKSIQMIDPPQMARSFAINSIGPALIAKHVKQHLPRACRTVMARGKVLQSAALTDQSFEGLQKRLVEYLLKPALALLMTVVRLAVPWFLPIALLEGLRGWRLLSGGLLRRWCNLRQTALDNLV